MSFLQQIFQNTSHDQPRVHVIYLNIILHRQLARAALWPPLVQKYEMIYSRVKSVGKGSNKSMLE